MMALAAAIEAELRCGGDEEPSAYDRWDSDKVDDR
jgi:hypothetical protein